MKRLRHCRRKHRARPSRRRLIFLEVSSVCIGGAAARAPLDRGQVHCPAPLQVLLPTHSLSGSVPAGLGVQVPRLPARLQRWQVPLHAVLQQRPSTQKPLAQSAAVEHVLPLTHLLQLALLPQSTSASVPFLIPSEQV